MGRHAAGGEEKTPVCKACLLCEMINANSNWIRSKWNTKGQISPWCSTSNPKADDLISLNLSQEWTWPPGLRGIQQYSQESWNTSQASKQGLSGCGCCSSMCRVFSSWALSSLKTISAGHLPHAFHSNDGNLPLSLWKGCRGSPEIWGTNLQLGLGTYQISEKLYFFNQFSCGGEKGNKKW